MKYPVGTVVYLIHTNDRGVVVAYEEGMYQIRLPDDLTIPAFEDDIALPGAFIAQRPTQSVQGNQASQPKTEAEIRYAAQEIKTPKGMFFCLEALTGNQAGYYRCWFVNEMHFAAVIEVEATFGNKTYFKVNQKLSAGAAMPCGTLYYDDLNDHPDLFFAVQQVSTAGLDRALEKTIRLKAKVVTHTPILHNIIDQQVWQIEVFTAKAFAENEDAQIQDLADYARSMKPKLAPSHEKKHMAVRNIREMAAFQPEIDLHIEALVAHKGKMSNSEILRLQLMHFESFMDKAARMNISNVFIIHGVGEGVLKSAIGEKLRARHDILKFHNHYHPKYGFGATEVIFR
jgi:hypothetical protein